LHITIFGFVGLRHYDIQYYIHITDIIINIAIIAIIITIHADAIAAITIIALMPLIQPAMADASHIRCCCYDAAADATAAIGW